MISRKSYWKSDTWWSVMVFKKKKKIFTQFPLIQQQQSLPEEHGLLSSVTFCMHARVCACTYTLLWSAYLFIDTICFAVWVWSRWACTQVWCECVLIMLTSKHCASWWTAVSVLSVSEGHTWWICTRWGRRGTWAPRRPLRSYTPRSSALQTEQRMAWRQTWPVDSDPDSVSETRGGRERARARERVREKTHSLVLIRGVFTLGPIQGPGKIT